MKMAYTKTCKNYDIETGDNGEKTTFPISLACDGSDMLMTLCSDDAEIITETDNIFLTADYIDSKLPTGCDCDEDGCMKYECTEDKLKVKGYSDSECQTENKSADMDLNVMKKQSFPPAEFADEGESATFVFEGTCKDNVYTMHVGSVFSDEKKYVSPSEITQEGASMKVGDKTVTASKNKDIATVPENSDDPSYAKAKKTGNTGGNDGDSSSAELMVLFGFLASIFAF